MPSLDFFQCFEFNRGSGRLWSEQHAKRRLYIQTVAWPVVVGKLNNQHSSQIRVFGASWGFVPNYRHIMFGAQKVLCFDTKLTSTSKY